MNNAYSLFSVYSQVENWTCKKKTQYEMAQGREGTWLAQAVEQATLDLGS